MEHRKISGNGAALIILNYREPWPPRFDDVALDQDIEQGVQFGNRKWCSGLLPVEFLTVQKVFCVRHAVDDAVVPCNQGRYVELSLFFLRPLLKNPVILIIGLYV
jgi:hypothetical protein